ncbi:MAG: 30S ribosomal protein S17 [Verrucomicrobiota bacterium]|nr:30S ribosomal protein S17 [Verrucomicrobiota bacterium]
MAKVAVDNAIRETQRKVREGVVVSDSQNKTLIVSVERTTQHEKYKKTIKKNKRYYVHDEENVAKLNDKVKIQETRPLSKLKRWRLLEILEKA